MKSLNKCEICGSKEIFFLFKQRDKNLNIPGKFSLSECKKCKSIFLNPQPSYSDLAKHYSKDKYYSLKKIDTNSRKLQMKMLLYKTYFSKEDNTLLKIILSPIKFIIRGTKIFQNSKLLDIGSGSGQFLYEMKKLGLEVYGIEPGDFDEQGSKKYKLNIKKSDLIKTNYPNEFFDIITMNHVLEHTNNPHEIIIKIKRILKKNGIFILSVPNSNCLAYKLFGKNWHQLDVPRHLINYSNKNLRFILEKHGFKVLKVRYNSRPNQFVMPLYFLLGVKKRTGIVNKILELFFLPLTWIINSLRIGDQIEVWCTN
ncbi:MAG: class I SAM-dependent methyltransferase [Nanobdellota archaeon]